MTNVKEWFGVGKTFGWLVVTLLAAGIAWGALKQDVIRQSQDINRLDVRVSGVESQVQQTRENQSSIRADVRNIKYELNYIRSAVDDVKKILIEQSKDNSVQQRR